MLTDKEMLERMQNGWPAGQPETACGNGSMLEVTQNVRRWLPTLASRFGLFRICDAGAGDRHWIKEIYLPGIYRAYDLIPRDPIVQQLDITSEPLPKCDAVLCRLVLNHLDAERVQMALALFRKSSRFLIATQFFGKQPQRSPQFIRWDLSAEPFNLGAPIEFVQDGGEDECKLALWQWT